MDSIYNTILEKLEETQKQHRIKIPLAIESGSRSWGFASPDSDYDCRFMYVHDKDWYVSILDKKDFIDVAEDVVYDINGWDLRKVIQHIVKSNAVMFEWISSNDIYIKNEEAVEMLNALCKSYFNPISVSYHYLSLAKNKVNEIIGGEQAKLKKYFYVLRPLANLRFISQYNLFPHMEYDRNLEAIQIPDTIRAEILRLMDLKQSVNESFVIPEHKILTAYFKEEIEYFENYIKTIEFSKNRNYEDADHVFKEIVEMMWNYE